MTVASLAIGFDGVEGDYHAGPTRKSGGREPWYPRGTEIRNERQLSIVAADELAMAAGIWVSTGSNRAGSAPIW
jgi:hypothetical protein